MSNYDDKIVELKADVHAVWKLQCQNLYNSKNLAALAVRECIQNSLDSVRAAIKTGTIKKGKISVGFEDDTLWIEDNGVGMDIQTLHDKFLTLGGTTKGDENNVGGFGLAKSVILGCGSGFKVETQDNVFTSEDLGKHPIGKQAYRQGTKITCYKPQTGDGKTVADEKWSFEYAIKDYIYTSNIPKDVQIDINGEVSGLVFKPTKTSHRIPAEFGIGNDLIPKNTELELNVYKTKASSKYLYVRLRGLTQFKTYLCWNANCDIVLDIDTKLDPRDTEYPFSTNREGLKAQYQGIIEAIRDKVSQAPLSISRDSRYKETLYDNVDDGSKESVSAARAMTETIMSTKVASVVKEVSKVVQDIKLSGGFTPQGGYVPATLVEYMEQYNTEIEKAAKKHNLSKAEVAKRIVPDTLFQLNNPLTNSWIIYEDRKYSHPKFSKTATVSLTVIWDTILKLMANNYSGMRKRAFYPGIVMEDSVMGMCLEKSITKNAKLEQRCYIMINPFTIPQGSLTKVALFLMGVAAHELAHFVCGSFEAHGETFSYTREAIMNANLDELSNVVAILEKAKIQKVLGFSADDKRETSSYKDFSLSELTDVAEDKGINIKELADKYPNKNIFRMRLTMMLKRVKQ